MKKVLVIGTMVLGLFTACKKNDNTQYYDPYPQFVIDSTKIQAYLKANNIAAAYDSNGFFYQIIDKGTGTDTIKVTDYPIAGYKGYMLDGTVFDANDSTNFGKAPLYKLVGGWQLGLRYIGKSGKMKLFLPSFYGYRDANVPFKYNGVSGTIPANSPLIFEVKLFDFSSQPK
ncbi:FKBP-type peptidyl-prolyl cis-trans isomerase [Chitinophaga sp. Hz27]|uniref:FKBP-type peptidyl-prolyl cis-trans isomerase n=1 Tax=Chitinophaga sp. Hz27 TaxID=3347169 RepID=UPI0035DBDAE7